MVFDVITCICMQHHEEIMKRVPVCSIYNLLVEASSYSNLCLLENCFTFVESMSRLSVCSLATKVLNEASVELGVRSRSITPIHAAVARGDYAIFHFLSSHYGSNIQELKGLVHFCIRKSIYDSRYIIEEKKQILEALICENENLVQETFDGTVPIATIKVHFELVTFLMNYTNSMPVDIESKSNLLCNAAAFFSTAEMQEFVQRIFNEGHTGIFSDISAVAEVFLSKKLTVATSLIILNGLSGFENINKECEILACAIAGGQELSIIKTILCYTGKSREFLKCVLMIAISEGHVQVIEYLRFKKGVKIRDESGGTLLHFAVQNCNYNTHTVIEFLVKRGISLQTTNRDGLTAFDMAKKNEYIAKFDDDTLELLKPNTDFNSLCNWEVIVRNFKCTFI